MAEPFIGQIIQAGFNFAPLGWAFCNGQLIAISQNQALFALLGTTYGGDGIQTFQLPNLQGRIPLHQGQGPGLSARTIGEVAGNESVTVLVNQLPMHTHQAIGSSASANQTSPGNHTWANEGSGTLNLYANGAPNANMNLMNILPTGGSQPHNNVQPFLAVNYCIALEGIFPSRN